MNEPCSICSGECWYYASYSDQMDYRLTPCPKCNSGVSVTHTDERTNKESMDARTNTPQT